MKNLKEHILFVLYVGLAVFLLTTELTAQTFTAAVSKNRVVVGEPIQIDFSVSNGGADNFKPPSAFKEFDILSGPNHSSSVQIINGNMSQSTSVSYFIRARKEGKFTIDPASVIINGTKRESNSIVIEVVKGNTSNANSGNSSSNHGNQSDNSAYNNDDNLFARTSVDRKKVYQGEQITVVHKVYTRLSLRGFQDIKFPSYNGF